MDMAVWGRLFCLTTYDDGTTSHYAISRPEEKKTDVNISVRMIADCVLDATDSIVLVSADSDLVPPLEFIQQHYPEKRIKVYFPPSNFSCDLKDNLTHHSSKPVLMHKNERRFRDAIMPDMVTDGTKRYEIPEKWIPANIVRRGSNLWNLGISGHFFQKQHPTFMIRLMRNLRPFILTLICR